MKKKLWTEKEYNDAIKYIHNRVQYYCDKNDDIGRRIHDNVQ